MTKIFLEEKKCSSNYEGNKENQRVLCLQGVYYGWRGGLPRTQKGTQPQIPQTYKPAVLPPQGQKHVTRPEPKMDAMALRE